MKNFYDAVILGMGFATGVISLLGVIKFIINLYHSFPWVL